MTLALYSPEDVTILLGGIYEIEGLAEGSFVSIAEDTGRWVTSVTADKHVTRTYTGSGTYTVTITLMSTSNANGILSAWASADGILYGAILPLFIKDVNGTSLLFATSSWIEGVPNTEFDVSVNSRAWVLKATGVVNTVGGNESGGVVGANLTSLGLLSADFAGEI